MQWLWYLARIMREQNGKGVFNLTSCRIEPVICNFHSENSSALGFDLHICSCCAKFFIVRDHQVLPRTFSDVELCCAVSAGERLSCSAQRESSSSTRTEHWHHVALRKGRWDSELTGPPFRVGKKRTSWKPLELHVEGDIRGLGICFSSLSTCFSFCCCHKVCSHPHHSWSDLERLQT